jgi:hypothetical protein
MGQGPVCLARLTTLAEAGPGERARDLFIKVETAAFAWHFEVRSFSMTLAHCTFRFPMKLGG